MVARVSLTTTAEGTVVVVKTALSGDRQDRRAEAQWLADAAQIDAGGVVPLQGLDDDPFVSIVTHRIAGDTLRTRRAAPPDAAAILLELVDLLVRLHQHDLIHGKLSLDHVILSVDGPVLCSPAGRSRDEGADSLGLARCIRSLLVQWDEDEVTVDQLDRWVELADGLADEETPLPLRRAARQLRSLASPQTETEANQATGFRRHLTRLPAAPRGAGFALVAAAVVASLSGLGATARFPGSGPDGAESAEFTGEGPVVEVDGQRYRIGHSGDQAVALDGGCPGQPAAVLLERESGSIWWFNQVEGGFEPVLIGQMSEAGELRVDHSQGCPEVTVEEVDPSAGRSRTRIVVPRA